jgi:ribose 5-phosphate isomerase B
MQHNEGKVLNMDIWTACDHAGFALKVRLMNLFPDYKWHDLGSFSEESVDYPDYAEKLAAAMKARPTDLGLLICGSGQGMAIKANRYPWIRAALCWNEEVARMARQHNHANVLCLAGRLIDAELNEKILTAFFSTPFEGGRHQRRVDKL